MDPINYSGAFADAQSPIQGFTQGLQGGVLLNQVQADQAAQQAALAQKQQMQADLTALSANLTPAAIAQASIKYPQLSEQFKRSFDSLSSVQQQSKLDAAGPVHAAVLAGQYDVAAKQLRQQADAQQNSGNDQEAQQTRAMADLIEQHPETAKLTTGLLLASALGPERYTKAFGDLGAEQRANDLAPGAVRKANADAGTAEVDEAAKAAAVTGARAGALAQAKNLKPSQVETFLRTEAAAGRIPKDELADRIASIPADPKALPDYLNSLRDAGMTAKEQKAFTTPDANAKLSADTQVRTTSMNNATQLAVQDRIAARQDAKGEAEANLDSETLTSMAQQYLAGDKSVMQNLGRGAQGSANIVALRKEITAQAKSQGMSGPAIAAKMAEFAGTMAGQRTAGTRIANVEMAANEAESLIPLAQQASAKVARSGFLPFGKAQVLFNEQTNDPAMRQFAAANNALVNVYARAISPSGTPTVADKEHGREMIRTAMSHDAYMAVTQQMQREIAAARGAPQAVRKAFNGAVTGQEMGHGAAPAAPGIPAGWSVKVH